MTCLTYDCGTSREHGVEGGRTGEGSRRKGDSGRGMRVTSGKLAGFGEGE